MYIMSQLVFKAESLLYYQNICYFIDMNPFYSCFEKINVCFGLLY